MIYKLYCLIVLLALYSPPLITRSSWRLDTLLIYLILPVLLLYRGRFIFKKLFHPIIIGFCIPPIVFLVIILLQHLKDLPISMGYWKPLFGHIRFLFILLLSIIAINTERQVDLILKFLIWGLIVHSFFGLITYFDVSPGSAIIKSIYKSEEIGVSWRASGVFALLHSYSFFLLFVIITAFINKDIVKGNKLFFWFAITCGILGLIPSFSKAAYIALIIFLIGYSLLNILYEKKNYKSILRKVSLFAILTGFFLGIGGSFYRFLPEATADRINETFEVINIAVNNLAQGSQEQEVNFVEGRLDWGWKNAIEVWKKNPIIGDLSASDRIFIHDGAYNAILAETGILGLMSYLIMIGSIFYTIIYEIKRSSKELIRIKNGLLMFMIVVIFVGLATYPFGERMMELFPVIIVSLFYKAIFKRNLYRSGLQKLSKSHFR